MSKMSRTKGATFERWLVSDLSEIWGKENCKRNLQVQHATENHLPDVTAGPYGIEAKSWNRYPTPKEWEDMLCQAEIDCKDSDLYPIAIYKKTRGPIEVAFRSDGGLVRMWYEDWKEWCKVDPDRYYYYDVPVTRTVKGK